MILIGQYNSPFVRRVAVALQIYEMDYEHRPWTTFADSEAVAAFNPLRRVPVLVLDSGEALVESSAILDHLDETVGEARALAPRAGPDRRVVLRLCGLATGLCDKIVSLIFEHALHDTVSLVWIARCEAQMTAVLDALESERSSQIGDFWLGPAISHADVAVTCAIRLLREAHPDIFDQQRWPSLSRQADRCEALRAFQAVVQRFVHPKSGSLGNPSRTV